LSGLSNIREFIKSSADFQNAFKILSVEAFNLAETETLIRSNGTIEFDTRAVGRVRALSGGNPFLINLLGNDIVGYLREQNRAYCLPEDVERVVKIQLDDRENSRVWSFLQYLLKEGEEDHASDICELPTLIALAYTKRIRGEGRDFIGMDEIVTEMGSAEVSCDRATLEKHLSLAVQNELLAQHGSRYAFANGWLAEWLSISDSLLPIAAKEDKELVLGRFRLGTLISQGGQASAFEGQDTRASNRAVVIKIYPRPQGISGASNWVIQEAKLLNSIEHTSVVRCIEFGPDSEKGDVIVLERVKGDTLRDLMTTRPKYALALIGPEASLQTQVKFIEQIAAALGECHRKGVVHKDLKPENIMASSVVGVWSPKIIDFGLATYVDEQSADYKTKHSYTVGYVAPERYRGEGRRASADIYSLGIVIYELLTGRHPFGDDLVNIRQAQEQGCFIGAKEIRPEIPLRLSELISEMLSPDPSARPNAFTLAGRLSVALETSDWDADCESAKRAYEDGDAETACDHSLRAIFSASDEIQHSLAYASMLGLLVDAADACGRLEQYAAELIQPSVKATVFYDEGVKAYRDLVEKVLGVPAVDGPSREKQGDALQTLIETLKGINPNARFVDGVRLLLGGIHPAVWPRREDVYLLGLGYKDAGLFQADELGRWCVLSARRMRERELSISGAQLWLRRTEYLGLSELPEFGVEEKAVKKLLFQTAVPEMLPAVGKQEPATSVVGEDERAHLQVDRIRRWAERLLMLHPYVQAVKRVRKDHGPALTPTRLLGVDNISQHLSPALESIERCRIIPAVMDESYCIPKGQTVLRINIVLPPGTTIGQREAAVKLLAADNSLFGAE
jgi:tRNA A-37 threonylcarbamoyl transferase component Bud32